MKKILYSFLSVIATVSLFSSVALAQWESKGKLNIADSELPGASTTTATITNIVQMVMKWILGIVGFVGIIGFAIAGIWYLTAAGDETRMEKGKSAMMWSIIGVMVALMGFVVIQAINTMLGGSRSDF